ncbi:MAG: DUF1080 domain-containing protein [Planctomycetaceae bacterium]|jgi:hypothetical protein|nr:DUF1080 domain-containing protein [Planctomycetaceae bacterium]
MKKILPALTLAVLFACPAAFAQIDDKEKDEGFVQIFNAADLNDFSYDPNVWSIKDKIIVGQTAAEGPAKLKYNTFLIWKGEPVEDFVMRFDIKVSKSGNSGLQYRSWVLPDPPYRVNGYQADFDGSHNHSGIMYAEGFGGILCQRGKESVIEAGRKSRTVNEFAASADLKQKLKTEDWNSYEVTAEGFTFTHKINGEVMSITKDDDLSGRKAGGILAFQAHAGPPMTVEIKNIRLKRIKKSSEVQ